MMAISQTVPRYRPGLAWLAALMGFGAILGVLASPGGASPEAAPLPAAEGPRRIGMNSCAARGCHGAVDAADPARGEVTIKDGAYTTWLNFDPHARAYDVLLESRSVAIAEKLRGPLEKKPAHEAGLCLSCHATVGPPDPIRPEVAPLRDGINCEGCHGPAETWNDKHVVASWRDQTAAAKALDGMADLSTPGARAGSCVGCHVGDRSRGMDMNHDLIAAGHPRLNFEFASYQAAYPKHWKEKHEKARAIDARPAEPVDFEAKSWAVGQVVTAQAVLRLLAARALASEDGFPKKAPSPDATWPEFSEYECFACHHGLVNPSPYRAQGRVPGRLPWATWSFAMLPELSRDRPGINLDANNTPWFDLQQVMLLPVPDPDRVADLAARSVQQLDALRAALERDEFGADRVASLLKGLADRPPAPDRGWDRLAQHELALMALARAARDLGLAIGPDVERVIRSASKLLEFPTDYDSPRNIPTAPDPNRRP